MIKDLFAKFRPRPTYPVYPPYHSGLYLEDYFCEYYYNNYNALQNSRTYIPVSWTTCYINKITEGLQDLLNSLDQSVAYFTVSQHDDAIREVLPPNTINFCAGGNNGGIPIPLVCSSIPDSDIKIHSNTTRDLLCSFIGSITHPIRKKMIDCIENLPNTVMIASRWNKNVSNDKYLDYLKIGLRSKFLLCPRGYGLNSFRLYESFQLGCVPVIITDKLFLPWADELDWSSFCVIAQDSDIKNLYYNLKNISDDNYKSMLNLGKLAYQKYFTLESTCKNILMRI